jgi:hypothetical protein
LIFIHIFLVENSGQSCILKTVSWPKLTSFSRLERVAPNPVLLVGKCCINGRIVAEALLHRLWVVTSKAESSYFLYYACKIQVAPPLSPRRPRVTRAVTQKPTCHRRLNANPATPSPELSTGTTQDELRGWWQHDSPFHSSSQSVEDGRRKRQEDCCKFGAGTHR